MGVTFREIIEKFRDYLYNMNRGAVITLDEISRKTGIPKESILEHFSGEEELVEKALEFDADIIGLSALLTTTMIRQKEIIEKLDARGLRKKIKVMVGGAPVTREWVQKIEADGYSEDAIGAVAVAKQLMGIG